MGVDHNNWKMLREYSCLCCEMMSWSMRSNIILLRINPCTSTPTFKVTANRFIVFNGFAISSKLVLESVENQFWALNYFASGSIGWVSQHGMASWYLGMWSASAYTVHRTGFYSRPFFQAPRQRHARLDLRMHMFCFSKMHVPCTYLFEYIFQGADNNGFSFFEARICCSEFWCRKHIIA